MKKERFEKMNKHFSEDEDEIKRPKRPEPKRRPVKNWLKAYQSHDMDLEDTEDFYAH